MHARSCIRLIERKPTNLNFKCIYLPKLVRLRDFSWLFLTFSYAISIQASTIFWTTCICSKLIKTPINHISTNKPPRKKSAETISKVIKMFGGEWLPFSLFLLLVHMRYCTHDDPASTVLHHFYDTPEHPNGEQNQHEHTHRRGLHKIPLGHWHSTRTNYMTLCSWKKSNKTL